MKRNLLTIATLAVTILAASANSAEVVRSASATKELFKKPLISFLKRIVGEILLQSGIMKTDAQQDTWAAAYNAALTGLLAGRAHGEFDPISFSENTLQIFARQAKAFADLAEKDLKDYQAQPG